MKEYKDKHFYVITIRVEDSEMILGFFNEFEVGFEAYNNLKKEDFPNTPNVMLTLFQLPFGFNLIKGSILSIATPITTRSLEIE